MINVALITCAVLVFVVNVYARMDHYNYIDGRIKF